MKEFFEIVCSILIILVILYVLYRIICRVFNMDDRLKHRFMLKNGFIYRSGTTNGIGPFEYYRESDSYCILERAINETDMYRVKKRYRKYNNAKKE